MKNFSGPGTDIVSPFMFRSYSLDVSFQSLIVLESFSNKVMAIRALAGSVVELAPHLCLNASMFVAIGCVMLESSSSAYMSSCS